MKISSQRRAAFASLLLAPALAACGFGAQTDQVYQAATGVNDRSGDIDVLNALIVSGEDGSGTLAVTLVNNSQTQKDALTGVTGEGVTVDAKKVTVPVDGLVNLAESGDVSVDGDGVAAGKFVTLTLTFENGQATTVTVPVVTDEGDYADVPLPKAKPSDDASPAAE
ncbi:MAG: hypothetical protein J7518_09520 [Nocardioidaceae bacterium]|nr:hypothetical protein [Nocardioidaceae bacterium]